MSTRPPSRVVFVGNIPYGLSEEQITDIFSSAGKVERFRLVYDSETGKPKGFGFADYPDTDSASSAVRNLNDYEIMGRKLRVDFSNDQRSGDDDQQHTQAPSYGSAQANGNATSGHTSQAGTIPPLPAGKELNPGVKCTDAISRTLNTLPPQQLLEILGQMKTLATNEPQRAVELLQQAPQLAYAVCEALLLMGLVTPEAIQTIVDPGAQATAPPQSAYAAPTGVPGYLGGPAANNTPPAAANAYAPPPMAAPAAAAAPDTDALLRAVMELPQAQVDALPESERQQVLALRAQFMATRR